MNTQREDWMNGAGIAAGRRVVRVWGLQFVLPMVLTLCWGAGQCLAQAQAQAQVNASLSDKIAQAKGKVSSAQRKASAERLASLRSAALRRNRLAAPNNGAAPLGIQAAPVPGMAMPTPGGTPDYFGSANWAFSPSIRKFVDTLPGLTGAGINNLGQYIPVAVADTTAYPGSDYYEIAVVEYTQKMHTDLPPTTLRGYVQLETLANVNQSAHVALTYLDGTPIRNAQGQQVLAVDRPRYLGPTIQARKDRPVRIKFVNYLPTGAGGDLFIPVDTTTMGAGMGPLGMDAMPMNYTQNRATLHLHGGRTPWISDGTPHQWITPAGEMTPYVKGVSVSNVPDMPDPGEGAQTFYFTNQQSARLMFYHDHSYGITRLNVYAGEAAGYVIVDQAETDLINAGLIPANAIPLIIQDKSFVDATTVHDTDPTWNWGTGALDPVTGIRARKTGDLWYPHVYSPAQNPYDISGLNPFGRWHYGPWFWPPTTNITHGPVPNPYYDPINAPWQPPEMPGVPHPSMPGESFFDTALVNGTAFPILTVEPKAYRFRILNAANDRFWNLQLYIADSTVTAADGRSGTEVKMVPAAVTPGFPATWPTDGREGGVPDPTTAGPAWIQIGTEGGFLPAPTVVPNQPITWNADPTTFNFGNVSDHALLLAPAERADVIIDFSAYANKTLILYNDAPAAFPALDARYDYFTGAPDLRETGGHAGPQVGFGPNIRTIMQIRVANSAPAAAFNLTALQDAFKSTATTQGVFARSQDPIIVGQAAYNSTYNKAFPTNWPTWGYVRIQDTTTSFMTVAGLTLTLPLQPKAIQDEMGEAFDPEYGRMSGRLGLELPGTNAGNQNFVLQNFIDPPTEVLQDAMTPMSPVANDGTQLWKITHNGVDTHPIHFHLFDVQLVNRVGWDGAIRLPDANELGWKDTVRVSPLEDTIVALRPVAPKQPFGIPDSIRPLDPTMPIGSMMGFTGIDPWTGELRNPPVMNEVVNFGWEYVWHCHILSHEEMDMMRPIVFHVGRTLPAAPVVGVSQGTGQVNLIWTDATPAANPATLGNPANEIGFRIERSVGGSGAFAAISTALANATSYADTTAAPNTIYAYRVIAFNAAGDSTSNLATLMALPVAPTGLAAVAASSTQVNLTWTDNALDETGFAIQRASDATFSAGLTSFTVAANATSYADNGVAATTSYYYRIRASNGAGDSAWSNAVTVTTPPPPPAAPSTLAGTAASPTQVNLTWTDNAANETGFMIQRATNATFTVGLSLLTAGVDATSYSDSSVSGTTTYYYRIAATNPGGNSAWSNTVTVTTPSPLPAAPSALAAATASATQVNLGWTDNAGNETGFTIQRATNAGFTTGLTTFTAAANATTYSDTAAQVNTTYYYRVRSTNAAGNSTWTNTASALVALPVVPSNLAAAASALSSNPPTVSLTWRDNSVNEGGFTIQRALNSSFTSSLTTFTVAAGVTNYTDAVVQPNIRYYYRVRATNGVGNSAWSNTVNALTAAQLPAAPTALTFVSSTRSTISMRWTDNAANEQGFQVERSTVGPNGPWTRIGTLPANSVTGTDSSLSANRTYWYRIRAYNAAGMSAYTNVASGATQP